MSQVVQTNSDYRIKTQSSGIITLDTGEAVGEVVITGNLRVQGDYTEIQVSNLAIEDNFITLNRGETGNGITETYAGIEIDRGFGDDSTVNPRPAFWFNETTSSWEIVTQIGATPVFENSSLRVTKILTNSVTDTGDLTLIGTGTGVVKVFGTTNYEEQVTADDDIPNKRYVDLAVSNRDPDNRIQRDNTYVVVQDADGGAQGIAVMALINLAINQPGTNYEPGDLITVNEGTARIAAVIQVDTVTPGGLIDTWTVINSGQFIVLPLSNFNISTTTDSVFGAGATIDVEWEVVDVQLSNPGDDYESVTVNFTTGIAEATATIDLDPFSVTYRQIESITVTVGGAYTSIPTVTFSAGINPALVESLARVVVEDQISATFYSNRIELGSLEILGNTISNNDTNGNIVFRTFGTAGVEFNRSAVFVGTGEVVPYIAGASIIYGDPVNSGNPSTGGTGLYYNNEKQTLAWNQWVINNSNVVINAGNLTTYPAKNELISKNKALVFSMLF
jgi:hypothetical protein